MKSWFLLYCKPRNEFRAQQNLTLQGVESYLPMRKLPATSKSKSAKQVPLFPSYMFVHFDPAEFSVSRLHSTRGVQRLVGCKEQLVGLDPRIIESVKLQEKITDEQPLAKPRIKVGDKVKMEQGPFIELEGIFEEECGNKRCHVLFTILGQSKRVNVSQKDLVPLSA